MERTMHGELAIAALSVSRSVWQWIVRLGVIGFIPLGLADASLIPLPSSMDILLIVRTSQRFVAGLRVGCHCGSSDRRQCHLSPGPQSRPRGPRKEDQANGAHPRQACPLPDPWFSGCLICSQIAAWLRELWDALPIIVVTSLMIATGLWFLLQYRWEHRHPAGVFTRCSCRRQSLIHCPR